MKLLIFECIHVGLPIVLSIASCIVALLSLVLPLCINKRYRDRDKLDDLTKRMDSLIKLAIEYPYLEDKKFISEWNEKKDSGDERYLRYDNYCNILFNYLHAVCEYYKYDKKKIEEYVDIKSWIRNHKDNWNNPVDPFENINGYDEKFRNFINSYLK